MAVALESHLERPQNIINIFNQVPLLFEDRDDNVDLLNYGFFNRHVNVTRGLINIRTPPTL